MHRTRRLFQAIAAASALGTMAVTPASALSLFTSASGSSIFDGVMFDLRIGASDLILTEVEFYTIYGPTGFELYVIEGGIGSESTNAAAWTLVDSSAGVASSATQRWDIADLALSADTTYGLYLTVADRDDGNLLYNTASGVGEFTAGNADLTVLTGYGVWHPFELAIPDRAFAGTLFYERAAPPPAVPLPAALPLAVAGFGALAMIGRRRRG